MRKNYMQFKVKGQAQAERLVLDILSVPDEINIKGIIRSLKIRFEDIDATQLRNAVRAHLRGESEQKGAS